MDYIVQNDGKFAPVLKIGYDMRFDGRILGEGNPAEVHRIAMMRRPQVVLGRVIH